MSAAPEFNRSVSVTDTSPAREVRPAERAVKSLSGEVTKLDALVSELATRLAPILAPILSPALDEITVDLGPTAVWREAGQHVSALLLVVDHVEGIASVVNGLLERLDI